MTADGHRQHVVNSRVGQRGYPKQPGHAIVKRNWLPLSLIVLAAAIVVARVAGSLILLQ
jgi:hypothetical protein